MIELTVVNASSKLFSGQVTQVTLPGIEGEFEIRSDHCPMLSILKPGTLVAQTNHEEAVVIYIESGVVSVNQNQVKVLADCASVARDENESQLLEDLRQKRIDLHQKQGKVDYQSLLNQLATTQAQLQSIQKLRKYTKKTHG